MYNIFCSYLSIDIFKFNLKKYKKEILDFKSVKSTVSRSNYGGWQSSRFKTVPKNFTDLFEKVSVNIKEIEKNLSISKNSGSIVFLNKDLDTFYQDSVKNYNEHNSSTWTIEPKENQCVLFPSYLKHYVEPNLNKKERISISFNYGF